MNLLLYFILQFFKKNKNNKKSSDIDEKYEKENENNVPIKESSITEEYSTNEEGSQTEDNTSTWGNNQRKNKKKRKKKKRKQKKAPSVSKNIKNKRKKKKQLKKERKKNIYTPIYQIVFMFFLLYISAMLLIYTFNKSILIDGTFVQLNENYATFIPKISDVKITENKELKDLSIGDVIYAEFNKKNGWKYTQKQNIFKSQKLKGKIIEKNDYYLKLRFNISDIQLNKLETLNIPLNYEVKVSIKKYFTKYKVSFDIYKLLDDIKNLYK